MTKIDIFSGFLGAGKTTLIKKLLKEAYAGEKLVLIENEFGEIGIDGGFLQDAGIVVNEMNSGCICCSLTGDFREALHMVMAQYSPDRILIEPSGVGKLSEIVAAVQSAELENIVLGGLTTVVDASKARVYMKNFGEFFDDQICAANCIVLSRTGAMTQEKIDQAEALLRAKNADAVIVSTPWDAIDGKQILAAIEKKNTLTEELSALLKEQEHHHGHECHDPNCSCHDHEHHHEHDHHHEHGHHEHEHEHHHDHDHEHEHECCHHDHDHEHHHHEHEHGEHHEHHHDHGHDHGHHHHDHEHHHDHGHECHDPNCSCHDHGHDADEVFQSWGAETAKKYSEAELSAILDALEDEHRFGRILRAKGYVPGPDGVWLHFDYTPGEKNIRSGAANVAGRLCVIGAGLKEQEVKELFGLG